TNINFSENEIDDERSDEDVMTENVTGVLSKFIHQHYFELEMIFTTYASIADSDDEIQIIEQFQELLRKVKESEREKIRFGA
ncbi:MAG: hypothetical protein HDT22_01810, partial [Ruminococcus sp.]|nr:hypothetical protein [Ruminococcus sp.]